MVLPAPTVEASVVVPTYGGSHRIGVLLESLTQQDCTARWEVVVVLDGADEATETVLAAYEPRLALRIERHPRALGTAAAMNTGLRAAGGRIVIRCDDDLTPATDMVRRHLAHHSGHAIGVIGPTRDRFEPGRYADVYGRPANERAIAASIGRPPEDRWIGWAAHNSAPREVLREAGGFDERFGHGEDFELGYRLHRGGLPMIVDPALQLDHRGPARDVATRAARAFVSGASRRHFESVHPGGMPAALPPLRAREVVWDRAVGILARTLRTRASCARVGAVVDGVLGWAPRRLTRRLVALTVEASGRAGGRRGLGDVADHRAQKEHELRRERTSGATHAPSP